MPWIEKEGRTVEEARTAALAAIDLPEVEVEIEVVREGVKGLFGLGGEPAIVRVRPRSEAPDFRAAFHDRPPVPASEAVVAQEHSLEPPEEADVEEPGAPRLSLGERQEATIGVASEMVRGILDRMGLKGEVASRVAGGTVYIEIFGDDMGILIGRGGKTLEALQELVRAGVQRKLRARAAVVVDVESYWERRRGRRPQGGGRRESSRAGTPGD